MTRTAVRSGGYQEYIFLCPQCRVEISFGLSFDDVKTIEKGVPEYDYSDPENATWADSGDDSATPLDFDPYHLVPAPSAPSSPLTPYMLSVEKAGLEHYAFERLAVERKDAAAQYPKILHLETLVQLGASALIADSTEGLGYGRKARSKKGQWLVLFRAWEEYTRPFRKNEGNSRRQIRESISAAEKKSNFGDALSHFRDDDRINSLWEQLQRLRKDWGNVLSVLEPLYVVRHWQDSDTLEDWTLAQKRFSLLRQFFADCYETFCRVSVIAACIEGVARFNSPVVPKRVGSMGVGDFELMPNGSKPDILKRLPAAPLFVPYMDSALRNGVQHHTAKYDAVSDQILYATQTKRRGIETFSMPYVRFAQRIQLLYEQLETVSLYCSWIKARHESVQSKLR